MSPRKTRSSTKQTSTNNASKGPPVKTLSKKSSAQNGHKKSAPAKTAQTKAVPAKDKASKVTLTRTRKPQRGVSIARCTEPQEDMVVKKEDCNNGLQTSSNGLPNDTVVKAEPRVSETPGEVPKVKATSWKKSNSIKKPATSAITLKRSSLPTAVDGITDAPSLKHPNSKKKAAASAVTLKHSSLSTAMDGVTDSPSLKQSNPKKKAATPAVGLKRSSSPTTVDGVVDAPKKKKTNGTGTSSSSSKCPTKLPKKNTVKNSKYVGAHMSINGGLELAVSRAVEVGALSFGMFLRSQRQWAAKPLTQEAANLFRDACREHDFAPHQIVPHGSYLLNCGAPDPAILEKSRATLVDELKRCEMLGLVYYNFHPGSTCGLITREECMDRIAESINLAHKETKYVISVIENMCKQGNTIGGDFRELRGIINRVKDKSRIGVCLDTCHAFAAGYDLATEEGFEKMMKDFEAIIGLSYLKAVHLNDSKGKVGCHLDRHENIGQGSIGLDGFRRIMNDPRLDHLPMILETPLEDDYSAEIALLNGLCSSL